MVVERWLAALKVALPLGSLSDVDGERCKMLASKRATGS
jgi:hypothetical protein